jgi:hypothetical protein
MDCRRVPIARGQEVAKPEGALGGVFCGEVGLSNWPSAAAREDIPKVIVFSPAPPGPHRGECPRCRREATLNVRWRVMEHWGAQPAQLSSRAIRPRAVSLRFPRHLRPPGGETAHYSRSAVLPGSCQPQRLHPHFWRRCTLVGRTPVLCPLKASALKTRKAQTAEATCAFVKGPAATSASKARR